MNKFRGPHDSNFVLVAGYLKELSDKARAPKVLTEEESKCLQSLTSNYRADKDRNERRVPDTCQWVLDHPRFLHWRKEDEASLLWISADPGCGKSVLSRTLVDESLLTLEPAEASVCYFFFKDDDINRQSDASALAAILHQLFVQKPALIKYAISKFGEHGPSLHNMFSSMWDILEEASQDPEAGHIICILDALDECKELSARNIIDKLGQFYSQCSTRARTLKFLITSRPYHDIELEFRGVIPDMESISLRGDEESKAISQEIYNAIPNQIRRISDTRKHPFKPEVQDVLIQHLQRMQNQTYLWLHLILNVIRKSLDSTKFRLTKLISKLPRTAEDAYEKILKKSEDLGYASQARGLLHIIIAAERPLGIGELNLAYAIHERLEEREPCRSYEELSSSMEPEDTFPDRIRSICSLFVSIKDSKIYLIHQTAKEYLISKDEVNKSSGHRNFFAQPFGYSFDLKQSNFFLSKICITLLMFREIEQQGLECESYPPSDHYDDYEMPAPYGDMVHLFCFLDYAAENWDAHFRKAKVRKQDREVWESALQLCNPRSIQCNVWKALRQHTYDNHFSTPTRLAVAAWLGLELIVKLELENFGSTLNPQKEECGMALVLAAAQGHVEIVKLLLDREDVDPNYKDRYYSTPFTIAASEGRANIVKLLLEKDKIELNCRDR
ncbi:MAG: hypothetical protein Q9191_007660, partial [Dirinaria sp. TL-2023a]